MDNFDCSENVFSFWGGIFLLCFFLNLGFFRESRFLLCQNQGSSDKQFMIN